MPRLLLLLGDDQPASPGHHRPMRPAVLSWKATDAAQLHAAESDMLRGVVGIGLRQHSVADLNTVTYTTKSPGGGVVRRS